MMIWFEMSYNKLDKLFSFEIEDEEEVYIEEVYIEEEDR